MHRIPDDVLLDIFSTYVENQASVFQISHVCRRWRQLIHTSPTFWANVHLSASKESVEAHAAYWLQRAGILSLSIRILFPKPRKTAPGKRNVIGADKTVSRLNDIGRRLSRLAKMLQPFADRWRSLELLSVCQADLATFFQIGPGRTPNLRRLAICADEDVFSYPLSIPFECCSDAGVEVVITNFMPTFTPSFGLKMTSLFLTVNNNITAAEIRDILQSCPNIEALHFTASACIARDSEPPCSMPHSRLTVLEICGVQNVYNVLSLVDAPILRTLDLSSFRWGDSTAPFIESLLQTCHCLSSVKLSGSAFHLPPLFARRPEPENQVILPNIETFEIDLGTDLGSTHAPSFVRRLVLPHAKSISLSSCPPVIAHQLIKSSFNLSTLILRNVTVGLLGPISIPTLTHLNISGIFNLLEHLDAPNLSSLSLHKFDTDASLQPRQSIVSLLDMLRVTRPPLRALSLSEAFIFNDKLVSVLRMTPLLEVLMLDGCPFVSDVVLQALAAVTPPPEGGERDAGARLLPRLKDIRVFGAACITARGLFELLAARCEPPLRDAPADADAEGARATIKGAVAFSWEGSSESDKEARFRIQLLGVSVLAKGDTEALTAWRSRPLL